MSEPLALSEASLLALRPALNAPVLNVGFLPVGPARAAIVAFAEEWGGIGLALGIRSSEGGHVAVFRNRESLAPETTLIDALDPILAEAEKLGFLFDEDMVGESPASDARERALGLWGRLMGEIDTPLPRPAPATPAATESIRDLGPSLALEGTDRTASVQAANTDVELTELVLDDVSEIEVPEISLTSEDELAEGRASKRKQARRPKADPKVAPAAQAPPAQPALSKFRHADDDSESGDGNASLEAGSELGRIPIVRVRKGRSGAQHVPFLARLLSSF